MQAIVQHLARANKAVRGTQKQCIQHLQQNCVALGMSVGVGIIVIALTASTLLPAQTSRLDSLKSSLQHTTQDTGRVRLLNAVAEETLQSSTRGALHVPQYAQEALSLAESLDDTEGKARALELLGRWHSYNNEYVRALEMQRKALALYQRTKNVQGELSSLMSIASVYRSRDQYSEALQTALRVLERADQLGDRSNTARAYNAIGDVYVQQGDLAKADDALHKARVLQERLGDGQRVQSELAVTLNNSGLLAMKKNDFSTAIQHYARAMGIQLRANSKQAVAGTLGNLGEAYLRQTSYDEASEAYRKSLVFHQELGDEEGVALSLNRLGALYLMLKQYDSSESYLQLGLIKASSIGAREVRLRSYIELARLDSARGNFAGAFEQYKRAAMLKDSLFGAKQVRQIAELKSQYDLENRERQITMLEYDNEAQRRSQVMLITLIVLAVAVALTAVYGYVANRRKNVALQRANDEINIQKQRLEEQSGYISTKNIELEQANYEYEYTVERVFELNEQLTKEAAMAESLQQRVAEQEREIERLKGLL